MGESTESPSAQAPGADAAEPVVRDKKEVSFIERALGAASSIAGLASPLWLWQYLPTDIAKLFASIGIVLLFIAAYRLHLIYERKQLTWQVAANWLAVGAVCASAAVVVTLVLLDNHQTQRNIVQTKSHTVALPKIRFVGTAPLDECQRYYGSGTIPRGYTLLIFDSPERGGAYYWVGDAANQPRGGWRGPVVTANNNPTWLSAVLMKSSSAKFTEGIRLYSSNPAGQPMIDKFGIVWLSSMLPPSQEKIPPLPVSDAPRNRSGCSPSE
jgi:hypothetical protein